MHFYADDYLQALAKEMKQALTELRNELRKNVMENIASIPFRKRAVDLGGGRMTSDKLRAESLMESILAPPVSSMNLQANNFMTAVVTAMGSNFEESHIGVYYEYGTGDLVEPDEDSRKYYMMGDRNPYRKGRPIVTRNRKDGAWFDMGGNERLTKSGKGGKPYDEGVVRAYHWFRNAFNDIEDKVQPKLMEAYKSVDINDYIHVKKKFTLGR